VTQPKNSFRDRLVAECVRLEEDRLGRILDDPAAESRARDSGGDFEHRIVSRAAAMPLGRRMGASLDGIGPMRFWLLVGALLVAFLAGLGTAGAVFGRESTVNFLVALSAMLGLQLLMLLLWMVFSVYRPRTGGGGLGRLALTVLRVVGRRLSRRPEAATVLAATAGLMRKGGLGFWAASALTHGLWSAFGLGALLGSLFALSVRQYDFVWGTTLLTEESFVVLVSVLSVPAQWLGWSVPDASVVLASRIGAQGGVGRELWSTLLLSSLVFYGLLPRLLLGLTSVALAQRAARRLRLDTGLPGYARLSDRLGSPSRPIGVLDPRPAEGEPRPHRPGPRPARVSGPVLLIGLELERDSQSWPPRLAGMDWVVLGRADDRDQRRDVLAALRARAETPGVVLVVCSIARTPDRGAERFLAAVREQTDAPVWAVLDEGRVLQARGGDRVERVRHWERAAGRAGVDYVLEADLDDPRHAGSIELVGLAAQGGG
jgi:hypothetical protein